MKPIFKVAPEAIASTSSELAGELGLPILGSSHAHILIGRREWLALPDLGVSLLNAKIDSGARSSSIHAEHVELSSDGKSVRFTTSNYYGESVACEALVVRLGHVRSSSGKSRKRIFIETTAEIPGGFRWKILVSLADRSEMLCPMLLGRRALAGYFLIDPQGSHMLGQRRLLVNPTRHLLRTDHG